MQLRAYLISGEFRVHRADCRDCQREARRSDSPGHPEEYASRADVIASLWSDIIAENPELYGTPGGLASLEAETIFLPCTSGLPQPARPGTAASLTSAGNACRPASCQAGPGRPASTAGGPACSHPGGRVKPTTGDSPPFDVESP